MTEVKMNHKHVRNIALDIVLTILTCFLYSVYVQYKQIEAVNDMLKVEKYNFVLWLIFTIITCGLYQIYHEYRKASDIAKMQNKDPGTPALIAVLLTFFGLVIVNLAIQQSEINTYYGNNSL